MRATNQFGHYLSGTLSSFWAVLMPDPCQWDEIITERTSSHLCKRADISCYCELVDVRPFEFVIITLERPLDLLASSF